MCLLCGFHLENSKIDPKDVHRIIKRETLESLVKITECHNSGTVHFVEDEEWHLYTSL